MPRKDLLPVPMFLCQCHCQKVRKYINLFVTYETCVHFLGNIRRLEATMYKAARDANQEQNEILNDAITNIENRHYSTPPRLHPPFNQLYCRETDRHFSSS